MSLKRALRRTAYSYFSKQGHRLPANLAGRCPNCYSRSIMNPWHRAVLAAFLALAAGSAKGAAQSPHEIFQALNALRVDTAQIYTVNELHLRRGSVNLIFSDGVLGFLQAYDGRVTGIVFSGRGHVNANPRDSAEKRSLAHFLGVPLLDQNFSRAYMRFDDDSASEILEQLTTVERASDQCRRFCSQLG